MSEFNLLPPEADAMWRRAMRIFGECLGKEITNDPTPDSQDCEILVQVGSALLLLSADKVVEEAELILQESSNP